MSASALILAGGSGTRFWPASRAGRPKQFLVLEGERSLLQTTVERLAPLVAPERIWVSTSADLATEVREQLPQLPESQLLLEPCGRNTAPAIAGALGRLPLAAREAPIAVLPSDHRVGDPGAFRDTLAAAFGVARELDRIVALGVVPRYPEVGYGYLEVGESLAGVPGLRRVTSFREKPDLETATRYVASGRTLWNAGMFVFRGVTLLERLALHAPELAAGAAAWARTPERAELYAALPSISIDYALIERLDDLVTLPLDCGWDDLGSWQALFDVLPADADGNRARGDAWAVDGRGNLLFAEEGTIAVLGVDDLVVVRSGGAVLVVPRGRAQDVRRVVERLRAAGRDDLV